MKENVIKNKSLLFAIKVVCLYKHLVNEKKEFVMSKQLLRSGTSIGASCREGDFAETKLDFIHKFSIAQKECNETIYWLEILHQTNYISESEFQNFSYDAVEIMKLLTSIIVSAKKSLNINR
ncbi:MAG: four helix bundle protein [Bacteroidales bacterium]|nr:four helix bundle protein [Bacteroidales bacterium]